MIFPRGGPGDWRHGYISLSPDQGRDVHVKFTFPRTHTVDAYNGGERYSTQFSYSLSTSSYASNSPCNHFPGTVNAMRKAQTACKVFLRHTLLPEGIKSLFVIYPSQ